MLERPSGRTYQPWSFSDHKQTTIVVLNRVTRDPYGDHHQTTIVVLTRITRHPNGDHHQTTIVVLTIVTHDPYGDHHQDQHLASNRDPFDDHHQNMVVTAHDYLIVQVTIFLLSHIYIPT